jgi:hypothetical protein
MIIACWGWTCGISESFWMVLELVFWSWKLLKSPLVEEADEVDKEEHEMEELGDSEGSSLFMRKYPILLLLVLLLVKDKILECVEYIKCFTVLIWHAF